MWACVRQDYLREAGATADMDDGLASDLVDTYGVAYSVIFKEESDRATTRVSIRTTAPHDAAAVAAHFGGGGHVRAAGATLSSDIETSIETVIPYIEATLEADR